jgi:hypothetical protein
LFDRLSFQQFLYVLTYHIHSVQILKAAYTAERLPKQFVNSFWGWTHFFKTIEVWRMHGGCADDENTVRLTSSLFRNDGLILVKHVIELRLIEGLTFLMSKINLRSAKNVQILKA